MKQWEYKVIEFKGMDDLQTGLNEFGKQGWELVGFHVNYPFWKVVFKKEA
ncbi:MAG: DUF4177 domain-containing protein [Firmicutes bacterium]|nr:DUF4177 domain-containing protein [Bacillota bacterium]